MGFNLTVPGKRPPPKAQARPAIGVRLPVPAIPAPMAAVARLRKPEDDKRAAAQAKKVAAERAAKEKAEREKAQAVQARAERHAAILDRLDTDLPRLMELAERMTWPRVVVNDDDGNPLRSELRKPEPAAVTPETPQQQETGNGLHA